MTLISAGSSRGRFRWRRGSGWDRAARVVVLLAIILTAMMVILGIGMWRNDLALDADGVPATATVLSVTALRTGIEYVDAAGASQRPPSGVLYPGKLTVGQQFLVEYSASDPSLVRVAGRTAQDGLVMLMFVVLGSWAIALPVRWVLRRQGRRQLRGLAAAVDLGVLGELSGVESLDTAGRAIVEQAEQLKSERAARSGARLTPRTKAARKARTRGGISRTKR